MNHPAVQAASLTHEAAQGLLPWLLAGTLDSAERAMVQTHLLACAQCQADLDWQRKLCAAAPPPAIGFDADRAYAKLLPRLESGPARSALPACWRRMNSANSAWLRWTAAAQLAAIGVLAIMLVRPGPDAGAYRALGAATPAAGNLVVVFKPDTTEGEMRRILQASGARLADGPTVTGAYVLALPAPLAPAALGRLRAEPSVTLAEPLGAHTPP
jgi:hypothetical protein